MVLDILYIDNLCYGVATLITKVKFGNIPKKSGENANESNQNIKFYRRNFSRRKI